MKLIDQRHKQNGAALIVALIMLILVSLLAAGGYMLSTTESRSSAGWSDRQRALFAAEGALKEAETVVRAGVASSPDVREAVLNKGAGYYVRHESTLPDMSQSANWTNNTAIAATDIQGVKVFYMVVFEGMASPTDGTEEFKTTGGVSDATQKPRFTLYAKAGGLKDETFVVLSTSKELD